MMEDNVNDDTPPAPLEEETLPVYGAAGSLSLSDIPLHIVTTKEDVPQNDVPFATADVGASLPDPDEIEREAGHQRSWSALRLWLVCLAVFVLVLGIPLGIVKKKEREDENASSTPSRPSTEEVREYLVAQKVSSFADMTRNGSPQNMAVKWLSILDEASLDLPVDAITEFTGYMFMVRYVMAVNYYAWDGDDWYTPVDFLSPKYVCNWNGYSYALDNGGGTEIGGLHCDPVSGLPVALDLGTFLWWCFPRLVLLHFVPVRNSLFLLTITNFRI
jgi:hypothetical protein